MHLAFILSDLNGGGAQKMLINLANWAADNHHRVDIVIFNPKGVYRDLISSNVNIYDLNKSRSLMAIISLSNYLKQNHPDVLFSALFHVNIVSILSKFLSFNRSTKVVISERNHLTRYLNSCSPQKRLLWSFLVRTLYRFSDQVIGISNGVCDDIKTFLPTNVHDRVLTIYNPVVTEAFFKAVAQDATSIFPKGCSSKFITSGRIVAQKDYPTLIRAFASYLKNDPQAHLVILGRGGLEPEIKDLCEDLKISPHVTFAGFVSEPLTYFKQADVFVITSAWEGFCNVIVEALFCGLKIVATDCPSGPSEILKNGRYGVLCPVGDINCISASMQGIVNQPILKNTQQKRAMDFHIDKIGPQFILLFEDVMKR